MITNEKILLHNYNVTGFFLIFATGKPLTGKYLVLTLKPFCSYENRYSKRNQEQ